MAKQEALRPRVSEQAPSAGSGQASPRAQVRVPAMLRPLVGGERVVAAEGRTLQDLIRGVDARHAGFAAQLLDSHGQLKSYVNVYVNDDDIRYLGGLETPMADGDVVSILPAVAGGTGLA